MPPNDENPLMLEAGIVEPNVEAPYAGAVAPYGAEPPLPYGAEPPLPYGEAPGWLDALPYGEAPVPLPYAEAPVPLPYAEAPVPLPYAEAPGRPVPLPYGEEVEEVAGAERSFRTE
jgi:hypothetical protein